MECPKCGMPLHRSIDSREKSVNFPFCGDECRRLFKDDEERDRTLHEARWHRERKQAQEEPQATLSCWWHLYWSVGLAGMVVTIASGYGGIAFLCLLPALLVVAFAMWANK